jgi:hypothetical protein
MSIFYGAVLSELAAATALARAESPLLPMSARQMNMSSAKSQKWLAEMCAPNWAKLLALIR